MAAGARFLGYELTVKGEALKKTGFMTSGFTVRSGPRGS